MTGIVEASVPVTASAGSGSYFSMSGSGAKNTGQFAKFFGEEGSTPSADASTPAQTPTATNAHSQAVVTGSAVVRKPQPSSAKDDSGALPTPVTAQLAMSAPVPPSVELLTASLPDVDDANGSSQTNQVSETRLPAKGFLNDALPVPIAASTVKADGSDPGTVPAPQMNSNLPAPLANQFEDGITAVSPQSAPSTRAAVQPTPSALLASALSTSRNIPSGNGFDPISSIISQGLVLADVAPLKTVSHDLNAQDLITSARVSSDTGTQLGESASILGAQSNITSIGNRNDGNVSSRFLPANSISFAQEMLSTTAQTAANPKLQSSPSQATIAQATIAPETTAPEPLPAASGIDATAQAAPVLAAPILDKTLLDKTRTTKTDVRQNSEQLTAATASSTDIEPNDIQSEDVQADNIQPAAAQPTQVLPGEVPQQGAGQADRALNGDLQNGNLGNETVAHDSKRSQAQPNPDASSLNAEGANAGQKANPKSAEPFLAALHTLVADMPAQNASLQPIAPLTLPDTANASSSKASSSPNSSVALSSVGSFSVAPLSFLPGAHMSAENTVSLNNDAHHSLPNPSNASTANSGMLPLASSSDAQSGKVAADPAGSSSNASQPGSLANGSLAVAPVVATHAAAASQSDSAAVTATVSAASTTVPAAALPALPKSDGGRTVASDAPTNLPASAEPQATPGADTVQMAQIVNRAAQSEMRIGMNTSAFGSVEVRAVVHANDVGVSIGSERGDLRSLIANELPGVANTLQQQNLRLNQVNFHQGFAFSNQMSSGGGDSQQRWSTSRAAVSCVSMTDTATEPSEVSEPASVSQSAGLSILA